MASVLLRARYGVSRGDDDLEMRTEHGAILGKHATDMVHRVLSIRRSWDIVVDREVDLQLLHLKETSWDTDGVVPGRV